MQDLANLAATLLNTGNVEAVSVASHPLSMIRAAFDAKEPAGTASVQLEWDGKGLPPVGAACQCAFNGSHVDTAPLDKWMKGDDLLCVAHVEIGKKTIALFWNMRLENSCTLRGDCYMPFRPTQQSEGEADPEGANDDGDDPVAVATERLRLAVIDVDDAKAKYDAANKEETGASERLRTTAKAKEEAQRELVKAIEAASRA